MRPGVVIGTIGVGALVAYAVSRRRSSEPTSSPAPSAPTQRTTRMDVDFSYRDGDLLNAGQTLGGRARVPAGLEGPAPLLVWLHGLNQTGTMHPGLSGKGAFDLRELVTDRIVAAPTQQKGAASSGTLWTKWSLDAFVDAVEDATGVIVDRARVIVAGHSGAGCNLAAGIYAPSTIVPEAVLAVDTCFDPRYGAALGKLGERSRAFAYFQRATWQRDFAGFDKAFAGRGVFEEVTGLPGNPHETIVPVAVGRALSVLRATV